MAYSIMSQPQGITIPISIFGDAESEGISAGNKQKTTTQAVFEGISEGIKSGISTYQGMQDIAIKQNQIEQAPIETEIKRQQLENAQTVGNINKLKLEIDQKTQADTLAVTQAKLEEEKATLDGKKRITELMSSPDPNVRRQVLSDPAANRVVFSDSKYAEQVIGALDASGSLTPDERANALKRVDFSKAIELEQTKALALAKLHDALMPDLEKTAVKIAESGNLTYLMNANGLDQSSIATRIQTFPSGIKPVDSSGYLDTTKPDNSYEDAGTALGAKAGKYDVFIREKDGKLKRANLLLSETENKLLSDYQLAYKRSPLYTPEPAAVSTPTPAAVPTGPSAPFRVRPFAPPGAAAAPTATPTPYDTTGGGVTTPIPAPQRLTPPVEVPIIKSQSGDIITDQARRDLEIKAARDPDLANRLQAKGLIMKQATTPVPKVSATPTAAIPQASVATPEAIVPAAPTKATTPTISVKPISLEEVDTVIKNITPEARRHVEPKVVTQVLKEPLLSKVDSLYKAVAAVESGGKLKAKSPTGPVGLFQLSKAAAKDVGVNREVPEENVEGGIKYLSSLVNRYKGDIIPALMAYNIGLGVIDDAIELGGSSTWEDIMTTLKYMQNRGMYKDLLTASKLKEVGIYPAKVLAYKEAFDSFRYA